MMRIHPLSLAALTATILGENSRASCGLAWLRAIPSVEFYVFRLRLLEDGDVGIGVFPKGEEVLVGGTGSL